MREIRLVCDACRLGIHAPEDGWLEWLIRGDGQAYGFRVCHKEQDETGKVCQAYNSNPGSRGVLLASLVGDRGIIDMVDILTRYDANRMSWGKMFVRLWNSGLMEKGADD